MPKPLSKVCILDTETTGTDPTRHGVIQLAGAILVNGEQVDQFGYAMRPFPQDEITDEALTVVGVTREQIAGWDDPVDCYNDFLALLGRHVSKFDKLDKMGFVAYNARFDAEMMRAWFLKCDDQQGKYFGSWFWNPPMDLMAASALLMGSSRLKLANYKLGTVCEFLGIEPVGELHDAEVDVDLTIKLYKRLTDAWFKQLRDPRLIEDADRWARSNALSDEADLMADRETGE